MAIRDIFKFSRRTFFNPSGWIDYEGLREQTLTIWTMLRTMFLADQPVRQESFSQAMERLNLTEKDVVNIATNYRFYAIVFLVLAVGSLVFAFYLLFNQVSILGWLLGVAVSILFLSQAFRFDFWSYQIKHRRLGVSFKEWKNHLLGGRRKGGSS